MSNYVFGSSLSYHDYLQAKSFVKDITSATHDAGNRISMQISQHTREVIASNEALARENIQTIDRMTGEIAAGFESLSYELQGISAGISELNSTFHWGFSQLIAGIGHMNDTLEELVKIAKTPVQTVAFNHFEIARDAFRQGLYAEALEELHKAISGDHTSPGYKLEWRFHQMVATIRLGFVNGDLSLIDLPLAEEAYLLAARYARTDYPQEAALAFLSAGWASYCQGKMKEALAHTEQALALNANLSEALFQAAKVRMALGQVEQALPVLAKAIDLDRFFALKAAGDGDFQKYDQRLREFLEAMRQEKYRQGLPTVRDAWGKVKFVFEHWPPAKHNEKMCMLRPFLDNGMNWALMDILALFKGLDHTVDEFLAKAEKTALIINTKDLSGTTYVCDELYQAEETYQEKVILRPAGFLRKEKSEMQTRTRTVTKTRTIKKTLIGLRSEIYNFRGDLLTSIDFCHIPAGSIMMGEYSKKQVTIEKDLYLGKYPVTQAQWQAIMGNNPSSFTGDLNRPVEQVSWHDCQAFIKKLNEAEGEKRYRLPTEAEWEYACRAGSESNFCFGGDETKLREYAWYEDNSNGTTHPVGQLKPNAWGLYDMHGNVREWCQDWYDDDRSFRVMRGGSWSDVAQFCRAAYRDLDDPDSRDGYFGFRLVFVP